MHNVKAKYLSIFLLAFATISSVSASGPSNDFVSNYLAHPYFFGELGYGIPTNSKSSASTNLPYNTDFPADTYYYNESYQNNIPVNFMTYGLGVGINLPKPVAVNWLSESALELLFNYSGYQASGQHNEILVSGNSSANLGSRNYTYDVSNYLFLLNYVVNFNIPNSKFKPFVEAGFGWNDYVANNFDESDSPNTALTKIDRESLGGKGDFAFAYDLGFGLSLLLNQRFEGTLGYRYVNAGNASTGNITGTELNQDGNVVHSLNDLTSQNIFSQFYLQLSYKI